MLRERTCEYRSTLEPSYIESFMVTYEGPDSVSYPSDSLITAVYMHSLVVKVSLGFEIQIALHLSRFGVPSLSILTS